LPADHTRRFLSSFNTGADAYNNATVHIGGKAFQVKGDEISEQ